MIKSRQYRRRRNAARHAVVPERERHDGLSRHDGGSAVELHRVLKPTGSLYLHCDPTASHYLKIFLDAIFGQHAFGNEIIWLGRTTSTTYKTRYWPRHMIYFCSTGKSDSVVVKTLNMSPYRTRTAQAVIQGRRKWSLYTGQDLDSFV